MTKDEALKILPNMKGAGDDLDKAIDLAIEALKRETSDDAVSRQSAIDAIERNSCNTQRSIEAVQALPSVQPVGKDINVSCKDAISRQAMIDALEKVADLFPWRVPGKSDTYDSYNEAWNDAIGRAEMEIEKLPSVQPQYTELTPEEAASEIASGSIMSASYWLDLMILLKQMGYVICRKENR